MDVEIVRDKMPLTGLWLGGYSASNVLQKILFVTGRAGGASSQLSRDNIEIEHKSQRTVSFIFEFASFRFSWQHGQIRMFAFQRLNARHFSGTFNALTLFGKFRSLFIQSVDITDLDLKIGFIRRC